MAGIVVRDALVDLLEDSKTDRNTWNLHLYINNHTPTDGDDVTDYTEATFGGYASIPLASWGAAFLNAANIAESDEILRTFTCTGAPLTNTVYGYYVTDSGGNLVGAELNPAGGTPITAAGQVYPVWPRVTLENA